MIETDLEKMGLTSGESRVYLALVELKESTVGPISKKSGVAYSKIYDVLSRLIEKGLASFIVKEKTKYFHPAPPGRLYDYLDKQKKEIDESKTLLDTILPKLEKIGIEEQESVRLFYGFNGILSAYEILIKNTSKDDVIKYFYCGDGNYFDQTKKFYLQRPQFFEMIETIYKNKNVVWNGVYTGLGEDPKLDFMKIKKTTLPLPGNFDMSNEFVLITLWDDRPKGILIQSKELARNFRNYFDIIWEMKIK